MKRTISAILALAMIFLLSGTSVFAAENPDTRSTEDEVTHIELNLEDFEVIEDYDPAFDDSMPSASSRSYYLNASGFTSTDISLPFTLGSTDLVTVIVLLKYMNGSTGTVGGAFVWYSGNLTVDGVARTIASNTLVPAGSFSFDITGVASNMYYVVKIYPT